MKKIIVTLMSLVFTLHALEVYATFSVEAKKSANLAFYSGGIVDEVYVDVSESVTKSQKLAKLQNDDLKAALAIAKANLRSAEVAVKFAKKDYERQLKIKSVIDVAMFDKYAFAYENAKTALAQAKANVAYQKSLLDKTTLHAPFDGVIFEKDLEVGDVVSGMMLKTVLKIQSKNERKLVLEFDQKYFQNVKLGDSFRYTIDGDTKTYTGHISKIYPLANSANRKIKAEVLTQEHLVGLFGDGYILTDKKE